MAAHLIRTQPYPLTFFSPNRLFQSKPFSRLHLFSTLPSKTLALTLTLQSPHLTYGPSLHKGTKPSHPPLLPPNPSSEDEQSNLLIDRDSYSRVFEIAAIRIPTDQSFALENRLRGHLLNWPRVRNIARVPGYEIDLEFEKILPLNNAADEDEAIDSINRRIYGKFNEGEVERLSPVLYREKLAKSFNCRGFLKFRNLAKMSRPKNSKRNKRTKEEGGGEGEERVKRIGKNDFVVVEVVGEGDGEDDDEEEDLSGLLGDDFTGGRWRGSTRLLLLDERYANKGVDVLPEAVKVDFCCCDHSL